MYLHVTRQRQRVTEGREQEHPASCFLPTSSPATLPGGEGGDFLPPASLPQPASCSFRPTNMYWKVQIPSSWIFKPWTLWNTFLVCNSVREENISKLSRVQRAISFQLQATPLLRSCKKRPMGCLSSSFSKNALNNELTINTIRTDPISCHFMSWDNLACLQYQTIYVELLALTSPNLCKRELAGTYNGQGCFWVCTPVDGRYDIWYHHLDGLKDTMSWTDVRTACPG